MTVFDHLLMLTFTIGLSMVLDHLWLKYVRPVLAERRGWPEVDATEKIPLAGWVGGSAFFAGLFAMAFLGFGAGY